MGSAIEAARGAGLLGTGRVLLSSPAQRPSPETPEGDALRHGRSAEGRRGKQTLCMCTVDLIPREEELTFEEGSVRKGLALTPRLVHVVQSEVFWAAGPGRLAG